MNSKASPTVELHNICKTYSGVTALHQVNLTLLPGTVTALAGENGAGKSTLIKVLSGAESPSSGQVYIGGTLMHADPRSAINAGVSVIYQELTDVPDMSVLENVLLGCVGIYGRGRSDLHVRRAKQSLARVGLSAVPLSTPVAALSLSERQLVEIARCLARDSRAIIFDEPTSSLAESDVEQLLRLINQLRDDGLAILYVSHHLDELFRVADRVVVLRDGRSVADGPVDEWTEQSLVKAMLAKPLEQAYPWRNRPVGDPCLEVHGITAPGVVEANLHTRVGEIVGLVGLAGAGRTELMKAIAGVVARRSGDVRLGGETVNSGSIRHARRCGITYAPEDRRKEGVILTASVADNLLIGLYAQGSRLGWLQSKKCSRLVNEIVNRFQVKTESSAQPVATLSGGNQQKLVLGRTAASSAKVILLDDPTRGVDVGAKSTIHEHILRLAESGISIVLTSSDTDEVLAVADRVYVMRQGRIVAEVQRSAFDREQILHLAAAG